MSLSMLDLCSISGAPISIWVCPWECKPPSQEWSCLSSAFPAPQAYLNVQPFFFDGILWRSFYSWAAYSLSWALVFATSRSELSLCSQCWSQDRRRTQYCHQIGSCHCHSRRWKFRSATLGSSVNFHCRILLYHHKTEYCLALAFLGRLVSFLESYWLLCPSYWLTRCPREC